MSESNPSTQSSMQKSSSGIGKLPDFKQSVKLKYVKLGYHHLISHGMYLLLTPVIAITAAQLSTFSLEDFHVLWEHLRFNLISVIQCLANN
ncbi:3-ketoacyl-CoA synthase 11, partial [Dionaea muscipula]